MNYILRLHVKSFIAARRDPSFALLGSRLAGKKFSQAYRFPMLLIRDTNIYVFLRILWNFKEHHFEKHLWTTASYFMNKDRNNSSKETDMVAKKNSNKLHTNLNKCQVENCPTLPWRNLISTCNSRVRSVPAGWREISSQ